MRCTCKLDLFLSLLLLLLLLLLLGGEHSNMQVATLFDLGPPPVAVVVKGPLVRIIVKNVADGLRTVVEGGLCYLAVFSYQFW